MIYIYEIGFLFSLNSHLCGSHGAVSTLLCHIFRPSMDTYNEEKLSEIKIKRGKSNSINETIPPEVVGMILNEVATITIPACMHVCHMWRKNFDSKTFKRVPTKERYCESIVPLGHMPLLQWAHSEMNCPLSTHVLALAAEHGHLELFKWARANDAPWNKRSTTLAAMNGHLEILQWAREHGCPWDEAVCREASLAGHMHVLQWAKENSAPWDGSRVCVNAALGGHLDILEWTKDHNCCVMNQATCANAAKSGHFEILKWAKAMGQRE